MEKAQEIATQEIKNQGYNPDLYEIKTSEDEASWQFNFIPKEVNQLGGDLEIKISKQNNEVISIIRGQ